MYYFWIEKSVCIEINEGIQEVAGLAAGGLRLTVESKRGTRLAEGVGEMRKNLIYNCLFAKHLPQI